MDYSILNASSPYKGFFKQGLRITDKSIANQFLEKAGDNHETKKDKPTG